MLTYNRMPGGLGWPELTANNPILDDQQNLLLEYANELNGASIDYIRITTRAPSSRSTAHALHMTTILTRPAPPPAFPRAALPEPDYNRGQTSYGQPGYDQVGYAQSNYGQHGRAGGYDWWNAPRR